MSLADYMTAELEPWKRKRFGDELPLTKALASLHSQDPLVVVQRPSVGGRWTVSADAQQSGIRSDGLVM